MHSCIICRAGNGAMNWWCACAMFLQIFLLLLQELLANTYYYYIQHVYTSFSTITLFYISVADSLINTPFTHAVLNSSFLIQNVPSLLSCHMHFLLHFIKWSNMIIVVKNSKTGEILNIIDRKMHMPLFNTILVFMARSCWSEKVGELSRGEKYKWKNFSLIIIIFHKFY